MSELEEMVHSARTIDSHSVRLNEGKLEGPKVRDRASKQEDQSNKDRFICCKLYKGMVKPRQPMELRVAPEVISGLLPVNH
jgi:hypothetical protein